MRTISVLLTCSLFIFLGGCTTAAFRYAEKQCAPEAYRIYPANYQNRLVTKSRVVEVPTGGFSCSSTTSATSLYSKTSRTEYKPETRSETQYYQEWETVDLNSEQRNSYIRACAQNFCIRAYGNPACRDAK